MKNLLIIFRFLVITYFCVMLDMNCFCPLPSIYIEFDVLFSRSDIH